MGKSLELELEILSYSYWEHFKFAKDIALILPSTHPKRVDLQEKLNEMSARMNEIKKEMNTSIQEDQSD